MVSFLSEIRTNLASSESTESVELMKAKEKIKSSMERRTALSPKASVYSTPVDDILKLNAEFDAVIAKNKEKEKILAYLTS